MDCHQVVWIEADHTNADRRNVVDWVAHDNALFQLGRLIELKLPLQWPLLRGALHFNAPRWLWYIHRFVTWLCGAWHYP